jgi:hypothetical protein
MSNDLRRLRKEQLHNDALIIDNNRGAIPIGNEEIMHSALSGDYWLCNTEAPIFINDLLLQDGDELKAIIDIPGVIDVAAIQQKRWKLTKVRPVNGQTIRAEVQLVVDEVNYNYDTKHLEIGVILLEGDNVNMYVNGLKYTNTGPNNALTYEPGFTNIVWIPFNAKFEIENGDYVEIELFNYEN